MDKLLDIHASGVSIDGQESQTSGNQSQNTRAVPQLRLDPISEVSGERSSTLNHYELVDSNRINSLRQPDNNEDSLSYNGAYGKPDSMSPQMQAIESGKDEDQYEVLVRLQRNSSYNYVPGDPPIPVECEGATT